MEIEKKTSEGKDKREREDATDSPDGEGKGQKEGEEGQKEAEEGQKKDSSRKAEEACLEGLSVEIQDMLVVGG